MKLYRYDVEQAGVGAWEEMLIGDFQASDALDHICSQHPHIKSLTIIATYADGSLDKTLWIMACGRPLAEMLPDRRARSADVQTLSRQSRAAGSESPEV